MDELALSQVPDGHPAVVRPRQQQVGRHAELHTHHTWKHKRSHDRGRPAPWGPSARPTSTQPGQGVLQSAPWRRQEARLGDEHRLRTRQQARLTLATQPANQRREGRGQGREPGQQLRVKQPHICRRASGSATAESGCEPHKPPLGVGSESTPGLIRTSASRISLLSGQSVYWQHWSRSRITLDAPQTLSLQSSQSALPAERHSQARPSESGGHTSAYR